MNKTVLIATIVSTIVGKDWWSRSSLRVTEY